MNLVFCSICSSPVDRNSGSGSEPICSRCYAYKMSEEHLLGLHDSPVMKQIRQLEEDPLMHDLLSTQESPVMQELRKLQDSPLAQQLRKMNDSPLARHLREVNDSPLAQHLREVNESPLAQQLRKLDESSVMGYLASSDLSLDKTQAISTGLEGISFDRQALGLTSFTTIAEAARGLEGLTTSSSFDMAGLRGTIINEGQISRSIAESFSNFHSVSEQLAELFSPLGTARDFALRNQWKDTFSDKIGRLHLDWLDAAPSRSLLGFAHLSRLHESIDLSLPFSRSVSNLIDEELGRPDLNEEVEESSVDQPTPGFNSELTAFKEESYEEVVVTAGFQIKLPDLRSITTFLNENDSIQYYSDAGPIITSLEVSLRHAVNHVAARKGTQFKLVAPNDVLVRCRERRDKCRQTNQPSFDLIHYADFMDLLKVVQLRSMWKGEFEHIFVSRTDFECAMHRISLARNAVAHSRPLRQDQYVTLVVEAHRIFESLRAAKII